MSILVLLLVGLSASYASPVLRDQQAVGGRVVGGRDATIEEIPYMVAVMVDENHFCGGAVITEFWVVSAVHCMNEDFIANYSIRAGSGLRNAGGVIHKVEKMINHPDYNSPTWYSNDVSLLKVVEPFEFSAQIQPIDLPTQLESFSTDTFCVVSGFGALGWMVGPSAYLQIAEVPIVSVADCRLAYTDDRISDDMLCAGFLEEGGVDVCAQDSGGPLAINGVLQGIVSWGEQCALPGHPGVYAKVSYFIDWIDEQISA